MLVVFFSIDQFIFEVSSVIMEDTANIYLFKVNNGNTKKSCEICCKLTIKTSWKHQNDVIEVVLFFLLLTLNRFHNFL